VSFSRSLPDPAIWTQPPWRDNPFRPVFLDVAAYPAAEDCWLRCRLESLPLYLQDPE
jgi:hypothetical protein